MHDNQGRIFTQNGQGIDVRADVAYVLGRSTGDVGQLCGDVDANGRPINPQNVNVFSYNKPFEHSSLQVTTQDRRQANYGVELTQPFVEGDYDLTKCKWSWVRPRTRFRILDFDGYAHGSISPFKDLSYLNRSQGGLPVYIDGSSYHIAFENFLNFNTHEGIKINDIPMLYPQNWYLGVCFIGENGYKWWTSINVTLAQALERSVVLPEYDIPMSGNTAWNGLENVQVGFILAPRVVGIGNKETNFSGIIPLTSGYPYGQWQTNAVFYSRPLIIKAEYVNGPYVSPFTAELLFSQWTCTEVKFAVTNQTYGDFLSDMEKTFYFKAYIDGSDFGNVIERTVTLSTLFDHEVITIPGRYVKDIQGVSNPTVAFSVECWTKTMAGGTSPLLLNFGKFYIDDLQAPINWTANTLYEM